MEPASYGLCRPVTFCRNSDEAIDYMQKSLGIADVVNNTQNLDEVTREYFKSLKKSPGTIPSSTDKSSWILLGSAAVMVAAMYVFNLHC